MTGMMYTMIYSVGRGEMSVWSKTPLKRAPFWSGFSGRVLTIFIHAQFLFIFAAYADNPGLSNDEKRMYELMNRVRGISI